jgi:arylsulfatase
VTDTRAEATAGLTATLLPWVVVAGLDVYLAYGGWPRPAWWQSAIEIGFFVLAGRTQWRLGRGWLRSPLLPAAVVVLFEAARLAPGRPIHVIPFFIGLVVLARTVLALIPLRSPLVGTLVGIAAVLGFRTLDGYSVARPTIAVAPSLVDRLTAPLPRSRVLEAAVAGPPIVVVSVDTLRADAAPRMTSYRRLAARGAVWERAMSASSWTLPALASLMTGVMPAEHGAACLEDGKCQGLRPGVPVLAEELRRAGYRTAAVANNPWIGRGTGFERGFETFVELGNSRNRLIMTEKLGGLHPQDDAAAVDAALAWLATAPARGFFLWVHLIGPHMPYLHTANPQYHTITGERLRSAYPPSAGVRVELRAAYDEEIAYTDRTVTRILDALEQRDGFHDGVIVFTSDHGEEFFEHGSFEHGHSHHGEVTDVPLVLVAPGVAPGVRPGQASLIDVAPTIRATIGLDPRGIDLRDDAPAGRIASAWGGLVLHLDCSAREAGRRVIVRGCAPGAGNVSAYDLRADPGEHEPVAWSADDPLVRAARAIAAPSRGVAAELHRDKLRALGYAE